MRLLERILEDVTRTNLDYDNKQFTLSFSAGITEYRDVSVTATRYCRSVSRPGTRAIRCWLLHSLGEKAMSTQEVEKLLKDIKRGMGKPKGK